jgi:hypothetical protein
MMQMMMKMMTAMTMKYSPCVAGYNCSLFAYGQTGSGKSYSVMGYGKNRGIVPITCDELFKTIESNKGGNIVSED